MHIMNVQNAHFNVHTNYCGFQIHKNSPWHMFSCTSLTEECVETVITSPQGFVRWHLTVWLNTMFKAVQFPTCITNLHSSLAYMNGDTLTLEHTNTSYMKQQHY